MPKVTRWEYSQSDPEEGMPKSYTTLEVAKACPKCKLPGREVSTVPVPTGPDSDIRPGTKAKVIECMNNECTWYRTTWVVQVNPDGTIPIPHRKEKQFHLSSTFLQRGRELVEATERQLELETQQGGAEIRGHFA